MFSLIKKRHKNIGKCTQSDGEKAPFKILHVTFWVWPIGITLLCLKDFMEGSSPLDM